VLKYQSGFQQKEYDLNKRQRKALVFIKQKRGITNSEYREETGATRATAKRDIEDFVSKGILFFFTSTQ
jgi:predicted HTH transcriptional regulator